MVSELLSSNEAHGAPLPSVLLFKAELCLREDTDLMVVNKDDAPTNESVCVSRFGPSPKRS